MKKLSGCSIDFNASFRLKLKDQIGAGGFSFVYSTDDPKYVVKVINSSDHKSHISYQNEKFAFQNIPRHENIIYCPSFKDNINFKGDNFCCLALENCSRGSIISMLVDKKMTFNQSQIHQIMLDAIMALHQLHTLPKPIAHRDFKGENLLLGEDGKFKLIDFGSISTRHIKQVTKDNRIEIEEDIDKNTTPTIRAPEQCDLFSNFFISEKVDIWALGCLLYILCFQKQPFETKLSIINCQYFLSNDKKYSKELLDLFPLLFKVNPKDRPNTSELLSYFDSKIGSIPTHLFNSIHHHHHSRHALDDSCIIESFESHSGTARNNQNKRPPSSSHSTSHSYHTHQGEKSKSFMSNLKDYFTKLTTKTESWVMSALDETEDGPNQKFVRYLVIKAWHKPEKIKKFYSILHKKYAKNPESTIIILKVLVVLHNYFKKGPNQVYLKGPTKDVPYPRDILYSINQMWKIILENNLGSNKDKKRNVYTTEIICEYSELLIKKFDLILKYSRFFEGNYSLNPFFSHPEGNLTPISAPVLEDMIKYLEFVIRFHKMLLLDDQLWKIQCSVATSILDEEYCLVSVITHLLASFKHATNYVSIDVNISVVLDLIEKFQNRFQYCYQGVMEFFQRCSEINEIHQLSKMIQMLPPELPQRIKEIPILQEIKNKKFILLKFLNNNNAICGIKIPLSYGLAVQDINLNHMLGVEEQIFNHQPNSKPQEIHHGREPYSKRSNSHNHVDHERNLTHRQDANYKRRPSIEIPVDRNHQQLSDKTNQHSNHGNHHQPKIQTDKKPPISNQNAERVLNARKQPSTENKLIQILENDQKVENVYMEFSHQSINIPMFQHSEELIIQNVKIPENSNQIKMPNHPGPSFIGNEPKKNPIKDNKIPERIQNSNLLEENKNDSSNFLKPTNQPNTLKFDFQIPDQLVPKQNPSFSNFKFENLGPNKNQNVTIKITNEGNQQQDKPADNQFFNLLDEAPLVIKSSKSAGGQGQEFIESNKETVLQRDIKVRSGDTPKIEKNSNPLGMVDVTFDQLFGQKKQNNVEQPININLNPAQNQQNQQNWFDFKDEKTPPEKSNNQQNNWDNIFNLQNEPFKEHANKKVEDSPKHDDYLDNLKTIDPTLMNKDITSSQLKKFIFHEISKNVADWIIDYKQLKFIKQIGSGGSAEVYRGLWRGTDVAVKKMNLHNLPENRKKEFEREISALMKLRPHHNLVNFMGVSLNNNDLCIIMDFCFGGTLFEWLHRRKDHPLSWKQRLKMAIDIACGMNYLHTCDPPIIHRDLKSLNLLLDGAIEKGSERFTVKLADFGLAKAQEMAQDKMTGLMGTYHWMAPEIFDNKQYTIKADVYSYAVQFFIVVWEIVTRQTPYQNLATPVAIMRYVSLEKGRPDLSCVPFDCPKMLFDLMVECWNQDPDKRPTFTEILERLKTFQSSFQ